jgi:multisubunit Na+/H+ antiporter MnhF subunit
MWGIGYVAARHVLGSYDEPHTTLYSMIVAFMFAEFGWLGFHWLMAYPLPGSGNIQLSQLALLIALLAFVAERAFASYHKYGTVRQADVLPSIILAVALGAVMLIFAQLFGTDAL